MKLTIKEYATANGISTQAVYAKIKRGTLTTTTLQGVQYIIENDTTNCNELVAKVESLTQQLLEAKEEIIRVQGQSMQVLNAYITETKQIQPPAAHKKEKKKKKKSNKKIRKNNQKSATHK